jgi:hypothetical protein
MTTKRTPRDRSRRNFTPRALALFKKLQAGERHVLYDLEAELGLKPWQSLEFPGTKPVHPPGTAAYDFHDKGIELYLALERAVAHGY